MSDMNMYMALMLLFGIKADLAKRPFFQIAFSAASICYAALGILEVIS